MSAMTTLSYTQTDFTPSSDSTTTWDQTYKWLIAWAVGITLLVAINRTKLGHVLIYYWLVLLILFLVVTQYQFIVQVITPIGQPAPKGS